LKRIKTLIKGLKKNEDWNEKKNYKVGLNDNIKNNETFIKGSRKTNHKNKNKNQI
jgi:hypothetical protein